MFYIDFAVEMAKPNIQYIRVFNVAAGPRVCVCVYVIIQSLHGFMNEKYSTQLTCSACNLRLCTIFFFFFSPFFASFRRFDIDIVCALHSGTTPPPYNAKNAFSSVLEKSNQTTLSCSDSDSVFDRESQQISFQ